MEFRFNLTDIFKEPIVEINNNMLPPGFGGDRRTVWDAITRTTEVVNAMGEASARAQGLSKPITTAERLRNSEQQKLYLLVDREAKNGKGVVTGMLKVGHKGLYIFDRDGHHYQVTPPCVLDFYVHESRQRSGLGKQLFEHMLQKEKIEPVKIAIDRPSDKFLGFLNKHYRLNTPIKQMNNFVVFDGFFPDSPNKEREEENNKISGSPGKIGGAASAKSLANGLQNYTSPLGRYGAPRPPCSMGQIIHNQSPTVAQVQESTSSPGRLDQTSPYYSSPMPRQAYSSYDTNVNSGVRNGIQVYGDGLQQVPQTSETVDGGILAQNYQYAGNTAQPSQQQAYTANPQQQYYQSSPYDGQSQHQMQMPTYQQQLQSAYGQAQYIQQQPSQQQTNVQYVQQPTNIQQQVGSSYQQQQLQPQIVASTPHLHTTQQTSFAQQPSASVQQQQQQPVAYQQHVIQPQVAASAPQLQIQQQNTFNQQQTPTISPQQMQQPHVAASVPQFQTPQSVNYDQQQQITNNQQKYYPPHQVQSQQLPTGAQTLQPNYSTQDYAAYTQNAQVQMSPIAAVQNRQEPSNNDHMMRNVQTISQMGIPQGQNIQMAQSAAPISPLKNNTNGYYTMSQAGDAAQNVQMSEQPQRYQYYDSAANEMRQNLGQNIEADGGIAKKPSASGDRNRITEKESVYELEYPPRISGSLCPPHRRR